MIPWVPLNVAFNGNLPASILLVKETVAKHQKLLEDPHPHVLFMQFGDNSLVLSVRVFLDSVEVRWTALSDLHRAIEKACREAGITIAFPQRDIHFDPDKPLKIRIDNDGQG